MDEFKKMAEPAGTATQVQGKDGFLIKLVSHTIFTITAVSMAAFEYLGKTDDDTVNTLDTLLATISVVGLANALLSILNSAMELKSPSGKEKLENRVLNSARNTMTNLCLIIGGIVFGMDTKVTTGILFFGTGVVRLLDCTLDVGGAGIEIQCPDEDDVGSGAGSFEKGKVNLDTSKSKTLVAVFGLLAFGGAIGLLTIYAIDIGEDLGDDTVLFWLAYGAVCLHTVLLMFTLAFNTTPLKLPCTKMFAGSDRDCDGVKVHALNEIPIVSALVFTLDMGIISLFIGEAIEADTSVKLFGAVLALLALVEIAGRRMI